MSAPRSYPPGLHDPAVLATKPPRKLVLLVGHDRDTERMVGEFIAQHDNAVAIPVDATVLAEIAIGAFRNYGLSFDHVLIQGGVSWSGHEDTTDISRSLELYGTLLRDYGIQAIGYSDNNFMRQAMMRGPMEEVLDLEQLLRKLAGLLADGPPNPDNQGDVA